MYKGSGGLTLKMRQILVSAARCAIKMRSSELDRQLGIKLLKRDLTNGLNHCFGNHNFCSPDFCTTARDQLSHGDSFLTQDTAEAVENNVSEDEDNNILGEFITQDLHAYTQIFVS